MKKYFLIFGVFLLVFGIACMTEEMIGCILMPISGILYFFGTTSKQVFSFFNVEFGKYLIIAGSFIIALVLIFISPGKAKELQTDAKKFKWRQFGIWKKRRTLFQIFILGLITFHICLVHFKYLNIPSICPRSSTDLATITGKFGLSSVFWVVMYLLVFIWGRVLCSWFCVYSLVQEQSNNILTGFKKKYHNIVKTNIVIYIITSVFWGSVVYNVAKYTLYTGSLTFNITNGYKVANLWVFWGGMVTMLPLTMLSISRYGVLGLSFKNKPYVIPMSFVYSKGNIYLHSRVKEEKIALAINSPTVCFEVDAKRGMFDAFEIKTWRGTDADRARGRNLGH